MARQISRDEWMRLHGAQRGIESHQPPFQQPLKEAYDKAAAAAPLEASGLLVDATPGPHFLGKGAFGKVYRNPASPNEAIKGQFALRADEGNLADPLLQRTGLQREVDIQARLGNELGLMPRLTSVETIQTRPATDWLPAKADVYIGQENLSDQGYKTLIQAMQEPGLDQVERAKLLAEKELLRAWAARAGVEANDVNHGNVMALPRSVESQEADGSRMKLIDPGMYSLISPKNPEHQTLVQSEALKRGYDAIGLTDMGGMSHSLVSELVAYGRLDEARDVVNQGLSDLAARTERLTEQELDGNILASDHMRFAGDSLGVNPANVVRDLPSLDLLPTRRPST